MDYRLVLSYSCWSFSLMCFCSSQSGVNSEDALCRPIGDEFLRLFWLMARMYERCGEPSMAQYYFTKRREKLVGFNEDDDQSNDCKFRVDLTNQKADGEIT
ncbi:unnamed protein product [Peronospora effusa]|nr:unnamed protein product [Peronospora effusa]